jgi:hypothetical protein
VPAGHTGRIQKVALLTEATAESAASKAQQERWIDGRFFGDLHEMLGHNGLASQKANTGFSLQTVDSASMAAQPAFQQQPSGDLDLEVQRGSFLREPGRSFPHSQALHDCVVCFPQLIFRALFKTAGRNAASCIPQLQKSW